MADALGVALFLFVASLVQGFLGFGFGIVAMTGLTFSHDLLHAAGVVNLTGLLVTSTVLWALRRHTLWGTAGRILPGILVGVLLGVTALSSLDRSWMVRALGVTVVGISAWNLVAPSLRSPSGRGFELAIAHVNHGLRGAASDGDEQAVRQLAATLGVSVEVGRVDPEGLRAGCSSRERPTAGTAESSCRTTPRGQHETRR